MEPGGDGEFRVMSPSFSMLIFWVEERGDSVDVDGTRWGWEFRVLSPFSCCDFSMDGIGGESRSLEARSEDRERGRRGDGTRWGWGIQSDESITFLL